MSQSYVSVEVEIPESESDAIQLLLQETGAAGLELRDDAGAVLPGVRAPGAGNHLVVAWFDDDAAAEEAQRSVRERCPEARIEAAPAPQEDWSKSWRDLIRPVTTERLWVGPPWAAGERGARSAVQIEPKMAFGTGDHPTTHLCLEAVDAFFTEERSGASVLDVGCGTAVLALAAKVLGAGRTVAIDNDPVAVELAREAATENGIEGVEISELPLEEVSGTFDLVLANILAATLIDMAPALAARTGTRLVLAGVLASQTEEVSEAFRRAGLTAAGVTRRGEWVRLDWTR